MTAHAPDGDEVAFSVYVRHGDRTTSRDVFAADTTGAAVRRLGTGFAASWSPRGDWIAFVRNEPYLSSRYELAVVHPDGTGLRVLTRASPSSRPAWTPSGDALVFTRYDGTTDSLWRVRLDGSDLVQLTAVGRPPE